MESVEVTMVIVERVEHLKGKYIKQTLHALEKTGDLTPEIRKAILDGFNGFSRAINQELAGYVLEQ